MRHNIQALNERPSLTYSSTQLKKLFKNFAIIAILVSRVVKTKGQPSSGRNVHLHGIKKNSQNRFPYGTRFASA
jgi:hypothetical protein